MPMIWPTHCISEVRLPLFPPSKFVLPAHLFDCRKSKFICFGSSEIRQCPHHNFTRNDASVIPVEQMPAHRYICNISQTDGTLWNLTRMTGTLHKAIRTFMIVPRSIILRMRYVSEKKCCRENKKKPRFMF